MAVIKDVARLSGLSVSAVSKYLNHPDSVREDTKNRVEAAIKELNYVPSATARMMRTKRSNMLAVVVPDIIDVFYSDVFNNIKIFAQKKGYTPILYTIENDLSLLKKYVGKISINHFDGLMLCFLDEDELFESYDKLDADLPVVMFSGENANNRFSAVVTDVFKASYTATKHLISCGCKRIAFVGGIQNRKTTLEKQAGYKKALAEAGLEFDDRMVYYGRYSFETGFEAASVFFKAESMPDGVFACSDVIAAGYIKNMFNYGVAVPDDVKVIGFDNLQISSIYQPGISSIDLSIKEMCAKAVDMIIDEIEKPGTEKKTVVFKNRLVKRLSTDKNSAIEFEI